MKYFDDKNRQHRIETSIIYKNVFSMIRNSAFQSWHQNMNDLHCHYSNYKKQTRHENIATQKSALQLVVRIVLSSFYRSTQLGSIFGTIARKSFWEVKWTVASTCILAFSCMVLVQFDNWNEGKGSFLEIAERYSNSISKQVPRKQLWLRERQSVNDWQRTVICHMIGFLRNYSFWRTRMNVVNRSIFSFWH